MYVFMYAYIFRYVSTYVHMCQGWHKFNKICLYTMRYSTEKSGKRCWSLYYTPPQNLWATPALTSNILTSGDEAATWWRKLLLRLRPSRRCIIIPCKEIQRWMKIYGSLGVTREIKLSSAYGKKERWNLKWNKKMKSYI